ncbi:MAG: hypothetical protein WCI11_09620 [Candidatus Methylumidiphilus sp.]
MDDIAILKELLKHNATISLEDSIYDGNKKFINLIEHDLSADGYSITVNGMPNDTEVIVIKADEFKSPDSVFAGLKGECKRADFIIIINNGIKKVIIYIEMKAKKTTSSEAEIIKQLYGAKCFLSYCREIGKTFWNKNDFLKNYSERYVTLRNISMSKRQTRTKPNTGIHDRPEKMLKISSPKYLHLNNLIGC